MSPLEDSGPQFGWRVFHVHSCERCGEWGLGSISAPYVTHMTTTSQAVCFNDPLAITGFASTHTCSSYETELNVFRSHTVPNDDETECARCGYYLMNKRSSHVFPFVKKRPSDPKIAILWAYCQALGRTVVHREGLRTEQLEILGACYRPDFWDGVQVKRTLFDMHLPCFGSPQDLERQFGLT